MNPIISFPIALCTILNKLLKISPYFEASSNLLNKNFNRGASLGCIVDSLQERFYTYDSGMVTERVWNTVERKWQDSEPKILPTGTGISKILANFIVLGWPRDMDITSMEVHLFSIDESGFLWDYLVGLGTASSVSLLEA